MPFDFEHNPRRRQQATSQRVADGDTDRRLAPAPIFGAGADGVIAIGREYKQRRHRMIATIIVITLFVLAAATAMLPAVLSSGWARERIVSSINSKSDGIAIEIDSWRFHWTSPQHLEGVRVHSTGQPEWKASIPSVTLATSLWKLLPFAHLDAGDVLVSKPRVEFYQPTKPSVATLPPPVPNGEVVPPIAVPQPVPQERHQPIQKQSPDATTTLEEKNGLSLPIADLSAQVKIADGEFHFYPADSLEEIRADGIAVNLSILSISSAVDGAIEFLAPTSDLAKRGSARCTICITDPKAWILDGKRTAGFNAEFHSIDLSALSPAFPRKNGAPLFSGGTVEASLNGSFDLPAKFDARIVCSANDIAIASDIPSPVASAQFSGSVSCDGNTLAISNGMLTSPWASATIDGMTSLSDGTITAGNLRAEADADLARIVADFAPLLGIREGYGVKQGLMHSTLTLESVRDQVLVKGKSEFSGPLAVIADGTAYNLISPSLDISLRKRGESPFTIDTFKLVTSFGQLGGAGDANGSRFIGSFNLASFRRDYGQFFHNMPEMSGILGLDLSLDSSRESHTDAKLLLTSKQLAIKPSKKSLFTVGKTTMRASAVLPRQAASPRYVANADIALIDASYASQGMKAPVSDRDVRLSCGCEWTPDSDTLKLGKIAVKGAWAEISDGEATLADMKGNKALTASGNVAFDWGRLSSWLVQAGVDRVSIDGREARPFRVAGSFADGADSFLANANAEIKTFIKSLSAYGLVASPTDATISLSGGAAKISYAPTINEGKANVACEVSLGQTPKRVRSTSRLFLLDNARINDTVLRELLGYVNPLLTQCSVKNGSISVSLMPFDIPLDKEQFQKSSFSSRISLDNLELAPSGDFEEVLKFVKLSSQTLKLKHQALDIVCKNGVIESGEQFFSIGKYPIVFRGRATLAGDADYRIDIPVGQAAVDIVGEDFAEYFKDRTLAIPVGGTVKHPRIDERSLRSGVKDLAREVVREEIRDNGQEILKKVWKNLQEKNTKKTK